MDDKKLSEAEQTKLYWSFLDGMARSIRNAPGSCARLGHEWTPWYRSRVTHDFEPAPVSFDPNEAVEVSYKTASTRTCQICKKVEQI